MNNSHNIILTDNAAKRITEIITLGQEKGKKLRISVESGGCFGFQYKYGFVDAVESNDIIIENMDAAVLIDDISINFMQNAVIDYVESLGFASFEIKNPNSKGGCGCGNSFST